MKALTALALLFATSFAHAATVGTCDGLDSIGNLIGQKFFANGEVRVAYVSTEEPAAAPDHALIFVAYPEMGVACFSINAGPEQYGFGSVDLEHITGKYVAGQGLYVNIPVGVWTGEDGVYKDEVVKVLINRAAEEPKVTIVK